jgi:hypothetical protein
MKPKLDLKTRGHYQVEHRVVTMISLPMNIAIIIAISTG